MRPDGAPRSFFHEIHINTYDCQAQEERTVKKQSPCPGEAYVLAWESGKKQINKYLNIKIGDGSKCRK